MAITRMLEFLQLLKVQPRLHPNFCLIYLSLTSINSLQSKMVHHTSNHLFFGLHHSCELQKCILTTSFLLCSSTANRPILSISALFCIPATSRTPPTTTGFILMRPSSLQNPRSQKAESTTNNISVTDPIKR
ncbi:hypothetical protein RHGRI_010714 [Rhododendron griersonianum]|uniref:Uncharacterized protein n=1 Tax=Rhododendron griersonianum TaxID=479676 RepID=A0AAV6KJN4_9ERIC|nr:hypothetical protein RHGRI_010714 [Rhododendron griersonianum]